MMVEGVLNQGQELPLKKPITKERLSPAGATAPLKTEMQTSQPPVA